MNIEELREYCLSIKGSTESFPFNERDLVFKIMGKMFALINIAPADGIFKVCLKCKEEKSIYLRETYNAIGQGTYSTSIMWISAALNSDIPDNIIRELINHSAEEVISKMSKKKQNEYKNM